MPITEFATLKLYEPYSTLTHGLDEMFLGATAAQTNWSSEPVYLYSDHDDPQFQRTIYLISGWGSVSAHEEWIRSDENQAWLKTLLTVVKDVDLKHLDFAFDREALDVGAVVYTNRKAEESDEATRRKVESAGWSGEGIDLENPESGTHKLTAYPHTPYADLLTHLGDPVEGETRIALKRIWASKDMESDQLD